MLEAPVKRVTNKTVHRQAIFVDGQRVPFGTILPPTRVRIEPTDDGFLLLYLDASGEETADTWHASVAEAKAQAKFEFEIEESDWVEVGGVSMVCGDFTIEPREQTYRELVVAMTGMARRVLFVVRGPSDWGTAVFEELAPWCVSITRRAEWPGTQLLDGGTREVREYSTSVDVAVVLNRAVVGLYDWLHGLPEDLAFLRADGAAMMSSVAHEREGGLMLSAPEREQLLLRCPGIAECVAWR